MVVPCHLQTRSSPVDDLTHLELGLGVNDFVVISLILVSATSSSRTNCNAALGPILGVPFLSHTHTHSLVMLITLVSS